MNEGAPTHTNETVIDLQEGADGVWRMKAEQAAAEADQVEASIDGFSEMSAANQAEALKSGLFALTDNNENRFLAEEIAKRIAAYEAIAQSEAALSALGKNFDARA